MKKFMTYAGNHKGVTIVMMAIMLAVLIMLASLAIDISYMYYTKNQLQVAADAAALAGAAQLDVTAGTLQANARGDAWKFACKNKAAGSNVYLVTNTSQDCDNPPDASSLNSLNSADGDIVIGFWNGSSFSPTIPLNSVANAVKIVAKRTDESESYGMPKVGLFLGKIFELLKPIGADWSVMAVKATAIAAVPIIANNEFTMCDDACNFEYPNFDTTERILETPLTGEPFRQMAWTALLTSPASSSTITEFICADRAFADICGLNIYTNPDSTNFGKFASVFYDPITPKTECISIRGITCPPGGTGWWVILPIAIPSACGSDLVNASTAKTITKYAFARIVRVCRTGAASPQAGCTSSDGTARPLLPNPIPGCSPGENSVIIDRFSCIPCTEINKFIGMTPKLVS